MSVITDLIDENSALHRRVAELEAERKEYSDIMERHGKLQMLAGALAEERNQLRAELAAIKAQDPVVMDVLRDVADSLRHFMGVFGQGRIKDGKALDAADSLLAAPVVSAEQQGVADGWQLVPVVPTMAMLDARRDDGDSFVVEADEYYFPDRNNARAFAAYVYQQMLAAAPVQQVSVPDEMRSLAQRLREYNQNPHHINPMSEAFHILVADAANALSAACVPKEIAAAITWSEHLLFECGALTSTRAPSVHVYNKTFAAVNEARAMLNAAPAAPAADAGIVDMYRHLQKVTPYRFKKIQDASITDGGDVMYFHKDRFDAALLADMAAHCAAKGVV